MPQPKPGDRFSFIYLDEEGSQPCAAIVQRILSNREEGLSSPEADFYVAEWLEALLSDPATPADPSPALHHDALGRLQNHPSMAAPSR